jgi:hypothetical protein
VPASGAANGDQLSPDRRTADPNGPANLFSHTSTAATLPGSIAGPTALMSS